MQDANERGWLRPSSALREQEGAPPDMIAASTTALEIAKVGSRLLCCLPPHVAGTQAVLPDAQLQTDKTAQKRPPAVVLAILVSNEWPSAKFISTPLAVSPIARLDKVGVPVGEHVHVS